MSEEEKLEIEYRGYALQDGIGTLIGAWKELVKERKIQSQLMKGLIEIESTIRLTPNSEKLIKRNPDLISMVKLILGDQCSKRVKLILKREEILKKVFKELDAKNYLRWENILSHYDKNPSQEN